MKKYTIPNDAWNSSRWSWLYRIQGAGYRGMVYATAYYAVDAYDISDDGVRYVGRYPYHHPDWQPVNLGSLYTEYVTSRRGKTEA